MNLCLEKQSVEKEILSLASKTLLELRQMWKSSFNSNPPPHAKKVLIPQIAYKLQEIAYGSISEKSARELENMADQMRKGKKVSRGIRSDLRLKRQWIEDFETG